MTTRGPPYTSHTLVTISIWFSHRTEHLCTVYDCHNNYCHENCSFLFPLVKLQKLQSVIISERSIIILKKGNEMTDGVKGSNFTLGLISRIATVCPGILWTHILGAFLPRPYPLAPA